MKSCMVAVYTICILMLSLYWPGSVQWQHQHTNSTLYNTLGCASHNALRRSVMKCFHLRCWEQLPYILRASWKSKIALRVSKVLRNGKEILVSPNYYCGSDALLNIIMHKINRGHGYMKRNIIFCITLFSCYPR